jgi:MFS family permease
VRPMGSTHSEQEPAVQRSGGRSPFQYSCRMKYETKLIWVLTITFGFVFLDRNAANFLMPLIASDLHFNNSQVGLVASALSFTWAVAAFLGGAYSDRAGNRKPLLLIAVVAFSLCSFASGLAASFVTLLAARLLMGLARYVATSLGMVVGLGEILGGVGAPAIAGRAADLYGLQAPVMIMAGCAILGTGLALFLRETAPLCLSRNLAVDERRGPSKPLKPAAGTVAPQKDLH